MRLGRISLDVKTFYQFFHLLCFDQVHNNMTHETGLFAKFILTVNGKCVLTSTKSKSKQNSNV